jgi:hypothetical protein
VIPSGRIYDVRNHRPDFNSSWRVTPSARPFVAMTAGGAVREQAGPHRASGQTGGPADPDDLPALLATAIRRALPGRPGEIVAHEATLLALAVAGWWLRPRSDERAFTVHREVGWSAVAIGLGIAMLAEVFPVHVLVSRSHPALAWVLTALTLYALVWLAGDFHGLRLVRMRIAGDALLVRVGLRWSLRVPFAAIGNVREVKADAPTRHARGYLRATAVGDPALILELRTPLRARGPYGSREVTRVGIAPDERARFRAALAEAMAAQVAG